MARRHSRISRIATLDVLSLSSITVVEEELTYVYYSIVDVSCWQHLPTLIVGLFDLLRSVDGWSRCKQWFQSVALLEIHLVWALLVHRYTG